jgi:hypothetical protein
MYNTTTNNQQPTTNNPQPTTNTQQRNYYLDNLKGILIFLVVLGAFPKTP